MGHKQGLDNVIDAAALLQDGGIRIALVGDGNDRARLERLVASRNLTNVEFIDMQGPGAWEATMAAADVLLVNQRASVLDMSLPSKLTSYFAAGRPVIAAVSPDSETAAEIASAEAGVVVPPSDPRRLCEAIAELRRDPEQAARLGAGGVAYAEEHLTRRAALKGYEGFLERLLVDPVP
jgi:glycosyltransferase involved in cell wall biosynthesis